ncbi:hypothetical protein [Rhodoferax sp. BAB1]|uniref:hypothetical protein n=1 Tax=Rhodoferax sp. BAB1 TaxID=2741720 RepID=UPI0015777325|nr:hypothetical protein [Rhodoferax sp. BAB1]QKO23273.1 hypothetical protein HTY51_15935 [Rhodoferax sp. BAB1]
MNFKRLLSIAACLLVVTVNAHARNPGENAQRCVDVSERNGRVTFTNTCNKQIFVIWCGDLKYTKKRCGDGPKGGFYTHSDNLRPGAEKEIVVEGQYRYAACVGGISFGNSGEYEDDARGRYRCLPR